MARASKWLLIKAQRDPVEKVGSGRVRAGGVNMLWVMKAKQ